MTFKEHQKQFGDLSNYCGLLGTFELYETEKDILATQMWMLCISKIEIGNSMTYILWLCQMMGNLDEIYWLPSASLSFQDPGYNSSVNLVEEFLDKLKL